MTVHAISATERSTRPATDACAELLLSGDGEVSRRDGGNQRLGRRGRLLE